MKTKENLLENSSVGFLNAIAFFFLCLLLSFIIALCGEIRIFLFFTPVPIVLQMQIIFLLAFLFGPNKAAFATFLFILQAILGLPVLPSSLFFTLTKGYYIGYFFASMVIGSLISNNKSYLRAFMVSLLGNIIVYFCGFLFFSFYLGMTKAFILGIFPFIIPDLIKNLIIVQFLRIFNWAKR